MLGESNLGRALPTEPGSAPAEAPIAPGLNVFQRIEDKYLVPAALREEIEGDVRQRLEPAYADASTEFTLVESVYFDSPRLVSFTDHIKQADPRFKIRVRRYGPNGIWNPSAPSFLELKRSSQGISKKERFGIGLGDYFEVMAGRPIPLTAELAERNPGLGMAALEERVGRTNELIERFELVPRVAVRYRRTAYEEPGFRVTFDEGIRHYAIGRVDEGVASELAGTEWWSFAARMQNVFSCERDIVVEAKYSAALPTWFSECLEKAEIARTSMSKYCWSMAEELEQSLSKRLLRG